jgi:hypothetical protein
MTVLDTIIADHDAAGRPANCAIRIWAAREKAALDALPAGPAKEAREDKLRADLIKMADWKPTWSARGIVAVKDYETRRKQRVQSFYARHIMDSAGPETRFIINDLLQRENLQPGLLALSVARLLQNWIEQNGQGLKGLSPKLRREYAGNVGVTNH